MKTIQQFTTIYTRTVYRCTQPHSTSVLKRFNKRLAVFQIQCNTISGLKKENEHTDPVPLSP